MNGTRRVWEWILFLIEIYFKNWSKQTENKRLICEEINNHSLNFMFTYQATWGVIHATYRVFHATSYRVELIKIYFACDAGILHFIIYYFSDSMLQLLKLKNYL